MMIVKQFNFQDCKQLLKFFVKNVEWKYNKNYGIVFMKVYMIYDVKFIIKVLRFEYYMYFVDLDVIFINVSFVVNFFFIMNLMNLQIL